jgi:hypothetical protein
MIRPNLAHPSPALLQRKHQMTISRATKQAEVVWRILLDVDLTGKA